MKAGIYIDSWKLPIFERHLTQAGFIYEVQPGISEDTLALLVQTDEAKDLLNVTKQANTEAARTKR